MYSSASFSCGTNSTSADGSARHRRVSSRRKCAHCSPLVVTTWPWIASTMNLRDLDGCVTHPGVKPHCIGSFRSECKSELRFVRGEQLAQQRQPQRRRAPHRVRLR